MRDAGLAEPLRDVAPLHGRHHAALAPVGRTRHEQSRELFDMLHLEREPTQRIAGQTVESSRHEHWQNGLVERVLRTMEEQVASIRDSDDMGYIHSIGFSSEVRKSLESSFLSAVL